MVKWEGMFHLSTTRLVNLSKLHSFWKLNTAVNRSGCCRMWGRPAVCCVRQKCKVIQGYNVSKIRPRTGHSLATRCSHMMERSSVCCGHLRFHGPSAWGTSWSPDICHQHAAHWRSVAPHDPIFSTTVKYNHQSLLCFLLYPLCIFLPGFLKFPPPPRPSPPPPLQHFSSRLSIRWNLQLAICQSLPCPTMTRMYIHTCTHRHMLRHPDRKSCCGV